MKLQISAGAACRFAQLAITARIVCGIVIDMPGLLNAGWLSILLGGALSMIPAFAVSTFRKNSRRRPSRALFAAFFAITAYDAAAVSSAIADSASYMALNSTAAVYLMLPQLLLCLVCMRLNGDALGAGAGIWGRLLPCLLAIVILLQAEDYRPGWLTPLFGAGASTLMDGTLKAAGWFSLPIALYLAAEPEVGGQTTQLRPIKALGVCIFFAALIAVTFSMMTPAVTDTDLFGRAFRLDALLANGRAGLGIQIPTISLWYVGLFHALLFDLFTAAVMLQSTLPGWNRDGCIWLTIVIVGLLAVSQISGRSASLAAAGWLFAAQAALLAAAMLESLIKKGGFRNA